MDKGKVVDPKQFVVGSRVKVVSCSCPGIEQDLYPGIQYGQSAVSVSVPGDGNDFVVVGYFDDLSSRWLTIVPVIFGGEDQAIEVQVGAVRVFQVVHFDVEMKD